MAQLFGYNVLKVRDKGAFTSHLERLRAPAVLFYQTELDYAREIKAKFPQMTVIVRNWPDSELHKHISPDAWIAQHEAQAAGGLYLYAMNESGLSKEVIQWHLDMMDIAIQKQIHLVLLNPATGTWDIPDFENLKPLLIKASQHRDLFIIGLHSYAGGIITSGIAGGFPPNAGIASDPRDLPGSKGVNLLPRTTWPSAAKIAENNWTTFHLGRHQWLIRYCESIGLKGDKLPRFALTETGFDFLSDIGDWLKTFNLPPGYGGVSGWRTLKTQWGMYFRDFNDASQAFVEQFTYAAENLLQGLEFALFFAYGDDGNWTSYNVDLSDIPMLLEAYAQKAVDVPRPSTHRLPDPKPDTFNARRQVLYMTQGKRYIRDGHTTKNKIVGMVDGEDVLTVYDPIIIFKDMDADETVRRWVWVETTLDNKPVGGFLAIDGVQFGSPPGLPPPAPEPPDDTQPLPNPIETGKIIISYAVPHEALAIIKEYLEATGKTARLLNGQFKMEEVS